MRRRQVQAFHRQTAPAQYQETLPSLATLRQMTFLHSVVDLLPHSSSSSNNLHSSSSSSHTNLHKDSNKLNSHHMTVTPRD
jgi:hypothetical protein